MQQINKVMIKCFAEAFNFQNKKILEIGSFVVPGQEELMGIRQYFNSTNKYIGCDFRKGNGVDKIEDVEKLSFKKESFDVIICLDTFEHVKNPIKAAEEISRVLKTGGVAIIASVFKCPIHSHPYDYWRFTTKCFEKIFGKLETHVFSFGIFDNPLNVYAFCQKGKDYGNFLNWEMFIRKFVKETRVMIFKENIFRIWVNIKHIFEDNYIEYGQNQY